MVILNIFSAVATIKCCTYYCA